MLRPLAKLLSFLSKRPTQRPSASNSFHIPFKQEVTNEVSELDGILLVRLGGCSAMQVRLEPGRDSVFIRIVPLAKATNLQGDCPWQPVNDVQLRAWIESDFAIWRWLLSKGIDRDKIERRLEASALSKQRPTVFARSKSASFRSKASLSLP
jgi:hypothetical protein